MLGRTQRKEVTGPLVGVFCLGSICSLFLHPVCYQTAKILHHDARQGQGHTTTDFEAGRENEFPPFSSPARWFWSSNVQVVNAFLACCHLGDG